MANESNLKPIRDSKVARELQEKSVEKRKQNDKKRKLLKELLIERTKSKDLEEMIDNVSAKLLLIFINYSCILILPRKTSKTVK